MLFPGYYYSIKINFFKHETGKISRFQPAACGVFNRKLIEFSTGNLCSFQPAICRVFNRQLVDYQKKANGKTRGKTIDRFGVLYPEHDSVRAGGRETLFHVSRGLLGTLFPGNRAENALHSFGAGGILRKRAGNDVFPSTTHPTTPSNHPHLFTTRRSS